MYLRVRNGPVAQLNRASDSGSAGRGFESHRGHKNGDRLGDRHFYYPVGFRTWAAPSPINLFLVHSVNGRHSGTALTLRVRPNGAIESMTPLFPSFSLLRKHAPYGRLAALRDRSHPPGSPQYVLPFNWLFTMFFQPLVCEAEVVIAKETAVSRQWRWMG